MSKHPIESTHKYFLGLSPRERTINPERPQFKKHESAVL